MKYNYDAIVIGDDLLSINLAFELSKNNNNKILLIKKGFLSDTITLEDNALIMPIVQKKSKLNMQLIKDSIDIFCNLQEYLSTDKECKYTKTGAIVLADDDEGCNNVSYNLSCSGLSHKEIDLEYDIYEFFPNINISGCKKAFYLPDYGHISMHSCFYAYLEALQRNNVTISAKTTISEFIIENNEIKGVHTDKGSFYATVVYNLSVNAVLLAEKTDDVLPFKTVLYQSLLTVPINQYHIKPAIFSTSRQFFIHMDDCNRIRLGSSKKISIEKNSFTEPNFDYLVGSCVAATELMPELGDFDILKHNVGTAIMANDEAPVIFFSQKAKGLVHVCGFTQHGILIIPRLAKLIANYHYKVSDNINISDYCSNRFQ